MAISFTEHIAVVTIHIQPYLPLAIKGKEVLLSLSPFSQLMN